jgi:hypothetical protein
MPNTLLTASVIAKEAAMILENSSVFVGKMTTTYEEEFSTNVNGYKKGQTVNVRRPARFTSTTGANLAVQDATETFMPLTVSTQRHVDVQFSSYELTLQLEDFSERILKPALVQLANDIDFDCMSLYNTVPNFVGTPGQTPNSYLSIGNAFSRLMDNSSPTTGLSTMLNPDAAISMGDAFKGLGRPISDEAIEKGMIAKLINNDVFMTQNIRNHTVGGLGGTPLVNGASQTGTSLITDGWTAAAANRLRRGDVFTIANVFAVNPLTRQSTGKLAQFVVTADVSSDGSGNATIPIFPAITTSGAYQTVTAAPADNAAITVLTGAATTAYPQNLMFHKGAFAFASVPLEKVDGAFYAQERYKGLSVRIVRQYQISTDVQPCRIEVLYGYAPIYPELACRITG